MTKLRISICRDYPVLSWWALYVITRVLIREEIGNFIVEEGIGMTQKRCYAVAFEDGGGANCQGIQMVSRSGEGKEADFTLEFLEGTSPVDILPSVQ